MEPHAEEIFIDALELTSTARDSFLLSACGDDPALKQQVERLLADGEKAEAYFTQSFGGQARIPPKNDSFVEKEGDFIGPYRLLHPLGEGGFGEVWKAEQVNPMVRQVAIKVVKAGMDTRQVLARFDAERQALARMEHPNIARVLDAGATPAGRPYFAMEVVNGVSITRFCAEQRLGTKERLHFFLDVCEAVNHAHQKGVIHRDIKPSNVLVSMSGDKPMVKVIDFGIAKAKEGNLTDGSLFTRVEQMVGTPMYMSPEQAGLDNLDIDTRTDIYSLGVLLYELLAGAPPFDHQTLAGAGYEEMRRIIREVDPPRPSERLTTLHGEEPTAIPGSRRSFTQPLKRVIESDLDWIVMKAIDKSRERRYETSNALIQDIGRFLANEPVLAKPPSRFYVLGKLAKRHQTVLLVLSFFLLLLTAGTVISSWLAIRATRAEQIAETRLAEVESANTEKEKARQDEENVTEFIVDVFRRPNPEVDGRKVTVVEALEAAEKKLDKDRKGAHASRVRLLEVMADTYENLGLPLRALELRRKALQERQASSQSPGKDVGTTKVMKDLIRLTSFLGNYDEARDLGLAQLELLRRQNPVGDDELMLAMETLAENTFMTGEHDLAISQQRELWRHLREHYGSRNRWTTKAAEDLSEFCRNAHNERSRAVIFGEPAPCIATSPHPAISREDGKVVPDPTDDERLPSIDSPSSSATLASRHALFLTRMEQAQSELLLLRESEKNTPRMVQVVSEIARFHYSLGEPMKAIETQQAAIELSRDFYGDIHPLTRELEATLGKYYVYTKEWDKAKAISAELDRKSKVYGSNYADVICAKANPLGAFFLKRFGEGLHQSETYLPQVKKILGPYSRGTVNIQSSRARCLAALGRTREAYDILMETSEFMLDDTFVHLFLAGLQVWFHRMEDYELIRTRLLSYARSYREQSVNVSHILDRNVLITCLVPLKEPEQGREILKSLEVSDGVWNSPICQRRELMGPMTRTMIRGIAEYRAGSFEKSMEHLRESIRLADEQSKKPTEMGINSRDCCTLYLSMALHALGRKDEALAKFREVSEAGMRPVSGSHPLLDGTDPSGSVLVVYLAFREARKIVHGIAEDAPVLHPAPDPVKSIFE